MNRYIFIYLLISIFYFLVSVFIFFPGFLLQQIGTEFPIINTTVLLSSQPELPYGYCCVIKYHYLIRHQIRQTHL